MPANQPSEKRFQKNYPHTPPVNFKCKLMEKILVFRIRNNYLLSKRSKIVLSCQPKKKFPVNNLNKLKKGIHAI